MFEPIKGIQILPQGYFILSVAHESCAWEIRVKNVGLRLARTIKIKGAGRGSVGASLGELGTILTPNEGRRKQAKIIQKWVTPRRKKMIFLWNSKFQKTFKSRANYHPKLPILELARLCPVVPGCARPCPALPGLPQSSESDQTIVFTRMSHG